MNLGSKLATNCLLLMSSLVLFTPAQAELPQVIMPDAQAQLSYILDGNLDDWRSGGWATSLAAEEGSATVNVRIQHFDNYKTIVMGLQSEQQLKALDIMLSEPNQIPLKRPGHWLYRSTKPGYFAVYQKHLRPKCKIAEQQSHGFSYEVFCTQDKSYAHVLFGLTMAFEDGSQLSFGSGEDAWLNVRQLEGILLLQEGDRLDLIVGKARWDNEQLSTPPQGVWLERVNPTAPHQPNFAKLVRTDENGHFQAQVLSGMYRLKATDSRQLHSSHPLVIESSEDSMALLDYAVTADADREALAMAMDKYAIRAAAIAKIGLQRKATSQQTKNASLALGVERDGDQVDSATSLFRMASVSKPVAAAVVLRLVDAGLWDLDEPLATAIQPEALRDNPYWPLVTTRMVLQHTSGLPNVGSEQNLNFAFKPGSAERYSGEAFFILRDAIEQRLQRPFEALAQKYVFAPAGMKSSSFILSEQDYDNYVGKFHDTYQFDIPVEAKANIVGGLVTTADDLQAFMNWMLSEDTFSTTLRTQLSKRAKVADASFGLGWQVHGEGASLVLSHGGSEPGARTFMALLPNQDQGLAVVTNASGGIPLIRSVFQSELLDQMDAPSLVAEFERWESFDW